MLDLHCHLLPGVDDGAPDLESAIDMARALHASGFEGVAPSPHLGEGPGGDITPERAARGRAALQEALDAAQVPLRLLPNAEHHVTADLYARLRRGAGIPLGGSGRWLLVELPWVGLPDVESALFRLQVAGYRLLLAHPERYSFLSIETCLRLVERGVRMQLELGSFCGVYGQRAAERANTLVVSGAAHVLASDLHRPRQATEWLDRALTVVRQAYGAAALRRATCDNPQALLDDASADAVAPLEVDKT